MLICLERPLLSSRHLTSLWVFFIGECMLDGLDGIVFIKNDKLDNEE